MGKFKKYGFTDESEADIYIEALGTETDEEGNTYRTHGNHIVKLGFVGVSGKYMVDIMWVDKKDKDWKDFRHKLNGKPNYHTFFGIEYSDNTV